MFTVCGIAGSLRKASYNRALLAAAVEVASDLAEISVAEIGDIPLYDGDVEAVGIPGPVERLAGEIAAADALLIVTPEYNAGVPGVLKNALDWASRPSPSAFAGKPTAIMGASPGTLGTARAQMQLRNNLANLDARVVAQPMVFVGGAGRFFDDEADGLDEPTREFVRRQIAALGALVS